MVNRSLVGHIIQVKIQIFAIVSLIFFSTIMLFDASYITAFFFILFSLFPLFSIFNRREKNFLFSIVGSILLLFGGGVEFFLRTQRTNIMLFWGLVFLFFIVASVLFFGGLDSKFGHVENEPRGRDTNPKIPTSISNVQYSIRNWNNVEGLVFCTDNLCISLAFIAR